MLASSDDLESTERAAAALAIRQPAVIRLLERELGGFAGFTDGDAFAVGLTLACRMLGGNSSGSLGLRLDQHALGCGLASVRSGRCDRAMVRSLRDQIEELPVVLTPLEQDAVATVIAGILWAVLDASVRDLRDLEDVLVA